MLEKKEKENKKRNIIIKTVEVKEKGKREAMEEIIRVWG